MSDLINEIVTQLIDESLKKAIWNVVFDNSSLLTNRQVIQWCYESLHNTKEEERIWGNTIIRKYCNADPNKLNPNWTTKLGEELVKEALIMLGEENIQTKVRIEASLKGKYRVKSYEPDISSESSIYEVKTRNWKVSGTAGEKVLGVSKKYSEIPKLTGKPLFIVCVSYQEFECREKFAFGNIFNPEECISSVKNILKEENKNNIYYIPFTRILEFLGYKKNCWK